MDDRLSYIENAGRESLRSHHENADMLRREANTMLTLFLAGAGVALAYAAPDKSSVPGVAAAAFVSSVYLFVLAIVVASKTLSFGEYPAMWNEPRELEKEPDLARLRARELELLQDRIDGAAKINAARSRWLNGLRIAASFTPIIALAAYVAARCWFSVPVLP
jgi:hypothetical protein